MCTTLENLAASLRVEQPWRQQRSLNERDLLSVSSSYASDYHQHHLSSSNRLYSSADRDRYDLHRERLEKYPLTRTARLDVQQRNTFNRSNHDRQALSGGGVETLYAARRAPPLATAASRGSGGGGASGPFPVDRVHTQVMGWGAGMSSREMSCASGWGPPDLICPGVSPLYDGGWCVGATEASSIVSSFSGPYTLKQNCPRVPIPAR